jgi:hypothetical protein
MTALFGTQSGTEGCLSLPGANAHSPAPPAPPFTPRTSKAAPSSGRNRLPGPLPDPRNPTPGRHPVRRRAWSTSSTPVRSGDQ